MQVFLHVFKEEWHDEASLRYNYDLFRASDGGKSGSPTMLLGWDKEFLRIIMTVNKFIRFGLTS